MGFVSRCEGWEGLTVDGKFPLLEWQSGWANRCVFLTVRQQLQTASIKLILASGNDANVLLKQWVAARTLSHPFLVQMMETGRCTIDGKDLVYVVTERADGLLSGVIPRKELDVATAKTILDPIVDALAFVHEKGLVHGSVKPSNIMLVGDQWKLSADELAAACDDRKPTGELATYDAPELASGILTPAADMWSLGMIVVEAFAQRTPVWDRTEKGDPEIPNWLPQPFFKIASGCLRWEPAERCSIGEIRVLLARYQSEPSVIEPGLNDAVPAAQPVAATAAAELVRAEETRSEMSAATANVGAQEKGSGKPEKAEEETIAQAIAVEPAVVEDQRSKAQEKEPAAQNASELEKAEHEEKTPEKSLAKPVISSDEEEPVELVPRSRLFADFEEAEHKSRIGPILLGVFALLAVVAVLAVRGQWIRFPRPVANQSAPLASQPSPQPPAPQAVPTQAQSTPSPADQAASQTQAPPETQSAPAGTQPVPETEAPSSSQSDNPPKEDSPAEKPAPKQKVQPTAKPANTDGAVLKRVLPNVAPGAVESMRAPVEIDLRVFVSEGGAVSKAEYLTAGPGNYFARVARQAAEAWKFTPPQIDGQPQTSVWTLRFRFERKQTEVTATQDQ